MNFGEDKCAHLAIEKGQIKHNGQHLKKTVLKYNKWTRENVIII